MRPDLAIIEAIPPSIWAVYGPLAALSSMLLAVGVLGWDPALRLLQSTTMRRTAGTFVPCLVPPAVLLASLLGVGSLGLILAALSGQLAILVLTPILLVLVAQGLVGAARAIYRLRLRDALVPAISELAALAGSPSLSLRAAFVQIGSQAPAPLHDEWGWVDAQFNQPVQVEQGGQRVTSYLDHPQALRLLAQSTPLELHAEVLRHLAAIYESGNESQARTWLAQLVEVVREQTTLRREIQTQLSRIRSQSYAVIGAFVFIIGYLTITQWSLVSVAFLVSPLGPVAALWCLIVILLPLLVGYLAGRVPELPL